MYQPYPGSSTGTRPFRDVESQIRDLTQDFAMSFNTGNYDQGASLFANDGVLMVPQSEAANGQKQAERALRQVAAAGDRDWRRGARGGDYSDEVAGGTGRC